jgi:EAL domain-containing protein (putative c-di-GMP-specific phosphodiesterase class I)
VDPRTRTYQRFHALKAAFVEGQYHKCLGGLSELARQGHPEAQYLLACLYAEGAPSFSISRNLALAQKWALAAETGGFKAAGTLSKALDAKGAMEPDPSADTLPAVAEPSAEVRAHPAISDIADELALHYQPIIEIARARVVGFQALARSSGGVRRHPAELFAKAEDGGFAAQLDLHLLRLLLQDVDLVPQVFSDPSRYISFNLSRSSLLDPPWIAGFNKLIGAATIRPQQIILRLTASAVQLAAMQRAMSALLGSGIRFAVDYDAVHDSAVDLLGCEGISIIRLGAGIVAQLHHDAEAQRKGKMIALLAHSAGCDALADGCASELEVKAALNLGYRYQAGHFYAPAVPMEHALAMVEDAQWIGERLAAIGVSSPATSPSDHG